MNDELTAQDIQKMQAELDDRRLRLMPELIVRPSAPAPSAT